MRAKGLPNALALLTGWFFLSWAGAQGLSLSQGLERLEASPGWQALQAQYAQARASYEVSAAASGLRVTAGGGVSALSLSGQSTLQESLTAGLNLMALPYGSAYENLRQARMALLRAELTLRAGEMDLLFSFLQQYWNAYLAARNLEVAQRAMAIAQEAFRIAQAKRDEGQLSEQGLKQAEAQLAQAQANLAQAQAQEAAARATLYAALGEAPGPPPLTPPPSPPPPPSLEEVLASLPGRPDVLRAENTLEDAKEALAYAERARFLPQGSLSLSYGQVGSATAGSNVGLSLNLATGQIAGTATYVPEATGPQGLRVGLSASFPLWAPDLEAQVRLAQANLRAQEAALASTKASAEADLRARHAAYLAALEAWKAAQKALQAADQALEDAQKRLAAGLITPLDLAQAELSRLQAAYAVENSQTNAYLAYLALRRSMARLSLGALRKEVQP